MRLYPASSVLTIAAKRVVSDQEIVGIELMTFLQFNQRYVRDRYVRYYIRSDTLVWAVKSLYVHGRKLIPAARAVFVGVALGGSSQKCSRSGVQTVGRRFAIPKAFATGSARPIYWLPLFS